MHFLPLSHRGSTPIAETTASKAKAIGVRKSCHHVTASVRSRCMSTWLDRLVLYICGSDKSLIQSCWCLMFRRLYARLLDNGRYTYGPPVVLMPDIQALVCTSKGLMYWRRDADEIGTHDLLSFQWIASFSLMHNTGSVFVSSPRHDTLRIPLPLWSLRGCTELGIYWCLPSALQTLPTSLSTRTACLLFLDLAFGWFLAMARCSRLAS